MIILASLNEIDLTPACFVKSTAACAEIDALAPFPAKISLFLLFLTPIASSLKASKLLSSSSEYINLIYLYSKINFFC